MTIIKYFGGPHIMLRNLWFYIFQYFYEFSKEIIKLNDFESKGGNKIILNLFL